jgi:hypothetical protein
LKLIKIEHFSEGPSRFRTPDVVCDWEQNGLVTETRFRAQFLFFLD